MGMGFMVDTKQINAFSTFSLYAFWSTSNEYLAESPTFCGSCLVSFFFACNIRHQHHILGMLSYIVFMLLSKNKTIKVAKIDLHSKVELIIERKDKD